MAASGQRVPESLRLVIVTEKRSLSNTIVDGEVYVIMTCFGAMPTDRLRRL